MCAKIILVKRASAFPPKRHLGEQTCFGGPARTKRPLNWRSKEKHTISVEYPLSTNANFTIKPNKDKKEVFSS